MVNGKRGFLVYLLLFSTLMFGHDTSIFGNSLFKPLSVVKMYIYIYKKRRFS